MDTMHHPVHLIDQRKREHCSACGNPDCPNVDLDPYWSRCPAQARLELRAAIHDEASFERGGNDGE